MDNLTKELIIIKLSDYQNDGSTFIYNFNRMVQFNKGSTVMIQSCSLYNSTFNITNNYGNNIFYINWLGTNLQVVIPDGYYSYDEINALIEYYLIQNDWYWIINNVAVYPIQIAQNDPRYKAQINITNIPSASQATSLGASLPSGATWSFPSTSESPQITINSGLGKIFGFTQNLAFPPNPTTQSTPYSYISDTTPILSPVYAYVISCNLLNTSLSPTHNNILGQIPITASFGSLIQYNTYTPSKINIHPSKYSQVIIKFLDQNLNPLILNDPEITLILEIDYV